MVAICGALGVPEEALHSYVDNCHKVFFKGYVFYLVRRTLNFVS
jgi:hypothetical protein